MYMFLYYLLDWLRFEYIAFLLIDDILLIVFNWQFYLKLILPIHLF